MKETGVIRRIDELGRIVIPKEIRKRLKITNGDQIDICTNNNSIILSKYEPLEDYNKELRALINSMAKNGGASIYLFDNTKCILSTNDKISELDYIDSDILFRLRNTESIELSSNMNVDITLNYKNDAYSYLKRIVCDYDFIGFIMISKPSIITKNDIELVNILNDYIIIMNEGQN